MTARDELLAAGLRHDPQKPRQSQRSGNERGVHVWIASSELRAAGIDPNDPPPTYRVWASERGRGSVQLRFYSAAQD